MPISTCVGHTLIFVCSVYHRHKRNGKLSDFNTSSTSGIYSFHSRYFPFTKRISFTYLLKASQRYNANRNDQKRNMDKYHKVNSSKIVVCSCIICTFPTGLILATSLAKSRKGRRTEAVICMMGGFSPKYSKENTTLKT